MQKALVAMLALGLLGGLPAPVLAAALVVDSALDGGDGLCTPGGCTLREAIAAANATSVADLITFDLGTGTPTIVVDGAGLGDLPAITGPLTIDGATGGAVRVEVAGDGAAGVGLRVGGGGSTLRGLVVNRFLADGVVLGGTGGHVVEGSYLGTDATGSADLGNGGAGVHVDNTGGNTIGPGNVISGNREGVTILGDATATGNVVAGNLIGTDATGTHAVPNIHGVAISVAVANTVGPGNTISGNTGNGVYILDAASTTHTADNRVIGNRIGTTPDGTAALGNGRNGVRVELAARAAIGAPGNGNLIAGNGADGVAISGLTAEGFRTAALVQGNRIGTDATGTTALPNDGAGIVLDRATDTLIGGTAPGEGNLIAGNTGAGVHLRDPFGEPPAPLDNTIAGNLIGTDATGSADLGNGGAGVHVDNTGGNTIGPGNVISGNREGVTILGDATATGNVVAGNLIGTDATGTHAVPNIHGVAISVAVANTVGPGNTISGNTGNGVYILDAASTTHTADNRVIGNRIGTTPDGTAALGNGRNGVRVELAARAAIGAPGNGNLIAGNGADGVAISGLTAEGFRTAALVQGNRIGTDATGTTALPNDGAGIVLDRATDTLIGGTAPGEGNLIAGNTGAGVHLRDPFGEPPAPLDNTIAGNLIGTDATGTIDLGNATGVIIDGVGGNLVGTGNVISGNAVGVIVRGSAATGNRVLGNLIGTDASGSGAVPNEADGVVIHDASGNAIGGTGLGEGNVIRHNGPGFIGGAGVVIDEVFGTADANSVRGNAISGNSRLGIDLGDDLVTPNDPGDADAGPNGLQNFPVLTAVTGGGASTVVAGTLDSTPGGTFEVDVYADQACDASGHGEGGRYLGSLTVTTDASGHGVFSATLAAAATPGEHATATATSAAGDSSEASPCTTVNDEAPVGCTIVGTAGPDVLNGTQADDVICGRGGDDVLRGLNGRDQLLGGSGSDQLAGGNGDDRLDGGTGTDHLQGDQGADRLIATDGAPGDRLDGGAGRDLCTSDAGDTRVACP